MAKKPKARWGEKWTAIEVPSTFSTQDAMEFAALLDVTDAARIAELEVSLNKTARAYRLFEEADQREKPGEIGAALDELLALAQALWERMVDIPYRTHVTLVRSYASRRFDYEEDFADGHIKVERDVEHLERLRSSIAFALQENPKDKGGKPAQYNLDDLAQMLGAIYQDFTGQPFRAPLSIKRGQGLPGEFVRRAAHMIDPGMKPSAVDTAMRRTVRSLKDRT